MSLVTLSDVLQPALAQGYAVGGLVTLGWEDMVAYTQAAEELGVPLILQAGPGCRAHTPLPVLGAMFRHLAENASVPVVAHLDHGASYDECSDALDAGFTSLMYDGSRLPMADNIVITRKVCELAHSAGLSVEGEIGFVGYDQGEESLGTDPQEAAEFAEETGVDAMAVSVGNVHLQRGAGAQLDEARIAAIQAVTNVPLVIHGGSGVPPQQRQHLARTTSICKYNIGTELRMAFGAALHATVAKNPDRFDRVAILSETIAPTKAAAMKALRMLMPASVGATLD